MDSTAQLNQLSTTLSPLPLSLRNGLIVVTVLAFLSFVASLTLCALLTWRIIRWSRSSKAPSQFVFLIWNLVVADILQSIAFVISSKWLYEDGLIVGTPACWAQGWFVSIGDLASGAFCFFIGLHTFMSVVFNYRMSNLNFGLAIAGIWASVHALTIVGVALHPKDVFVRAVSWCWFNSAYPQERLYLHYFWIFTFEFGTVLIYIAMSVALQYRIKSNFYAACATQTKQARTAARLMVIYPIIYVICTLPLATLRMVSMASATMPSFAWFCFAGAMITSNGWLDVFLYTITRRIMLFSDEPPPDNGLETFSMPFNGTAARRFGTKTTCEYSGDMMGGRRWIGRHDSKSTTASLFGSKSQFFEDSPFASQHGSPKLTSGETGLAVKTKTTVEVRSEPLIEMQDLQAIRALQDQVDQATQLPSQAEGTGPSMDEVEFATKPAGWP